MGRAVMRVTQRGVTLIELAVVLTALVLVAGLVLPSMLSSAMRARRIDAVTALSKLQAAQERHRSDHGVYSKTLPKGIGPRSAAGHYDIVMLEAQGEHFTAEAVARSDGPQAGDEVCARITLQIEQGFAQRGPLAACWNQ